MKKLNIKKVTIMLWCTILYGAAVAQTDPVKGRVTADSDGIGLPGVNIIIKGTSTGAITDTNGNYTIAASSSDVLKFSYIGFISQEITVASQTTINVQMSEDSGTLEEVVVLGYTSKKKSEIASAVSTVSAKQLNNVTTTSVTQALQGKIPGVFITSPDGRAGFDPQIRIRGIGSAFLSSGPLYVIDGLIGSYDSVDPADVESVSVLKDAGATALYGSRAANGVIVMTTKSGKSGKTQFSYEASVGVAKPNFGKFELMNSKELYDFHELINPGGLDASRLDTDTDWLDLAYRNATQQRHIFTASGGNDKTQYYLSGTYFDENGALEKDNYKRYGLRLNVKNQLSDRVNLTSNIAVRGMKGSRGNVSSYQAFTNTPFDAPHDSEGNPVDAKESEDWFGRDKNNFLYEDQYNKSERKGLLTYADMKLGIDITDWLSFTTSNRGEFEYGRSTSNADYRTNAGAADNGTIYNGTNERFYFITSNLFSATKNFGLHRVSGLVGYEVNKTSGNGFDVNDVNHVPDFSAAFTQRPKTSSYNSFRSTNESILSQADYAYGERYFLTASLRRDGSSRYGANNRWGNFWSLAGAWTISEESFFPDTDVISYLKLRGSYGKLGNANMNETWQYANYKVTFADDGTGSGDSEPAIQNATRGGNPDLTWESSKTLDIGLDFTVFDKVNFQVDYYNRNIDDLIFFDAESVTGDGLLGQYINGGQMQSSGFEVFADSRIIDGDIKWDLSLNLSFNTSKMTELVDDEEVPYGNQRLAEGEKFGSWYMKKWMGVDAQTGDPQWEEILYDGEGNETDRQLTGDYALATPQFIGSNGLPDVIGGLGSTISYKGLSLSASFSFVQGIDVYHDTRFYFDHDGTYTNFNMMKLADGWSRWEKPGDVATHPRPVYTGNNNSSLTSSRFIEDGSFIRLRNIRLDYNIPETWVNKIGLRSARVYATADNLWTLTDFTGTDPEVGLNGRASFPYSVPKRLFLGLSIGF